MHRTRFHRFAAELAGALTVAVTCMAVAGTGGAAQTSLEGPLAPHLGEPSLQMQQVFKGGRFPNVVVALDGTVLVLWNGVKVRRSEDGGTTWGPEITVGKGFMGGGVIVNEGNGEVLAFVEEHHPPAPMTVYRSRDRGKTWAPMDVAIKPDSRGNVPSMHMNEHGITLRHGTHKGRLLRPARWYAGKNARDRWPQHYTTAIYSDDGGKTWHTSEPFPAFGTGEATVAERSDGRIYYNSRRHWAPEGANPRRRWTAWSDDGGATWKGLAICEVLPDGPQNTNYGCMGGLVRLPVRGRDILLYSNCDSPGGRNHGTVWASFDGGKTWPLKRLVFDGGFAYSSLAAGRPGTPSEGWIYLHFEGGPKGGGTVARLNLSWVLGGEKTGDGDLPSWLGAAGASAGPSGSDGFVSLFDGKTLDGWHAVPEESAPDWTVSDGAIVGRGSADRLTYLVWKEAHLTDFELRLRYRLPGKGNTGIEIRSQPDASGKRPFEGYHADLGHVGIGPHILGAWDFHFARRREHPCPRGTRLVIDEDGAARSGTIAGALTAADICPHGWNDVHVSARGNHFRFFINGKLASEFTDYAKEGRLDEGAIGLQIHDKGMRVEFKDIRLKRLVSGHRPAAASGGLTFAAHSPWRIVWACRANGP
jgi:sialidase-1